MSAVSIILECGYVDIKCVSSVVSNDDFVTIHQTIGGAICIKKSVIKKIMLNGREMEL